ncbi:MAG: methyltransferase domain-containing protein [Chloroflexi bacterium]|nr:MAG: methyltransferase domain-containing protein [Chloroflexota bacterium]
MTQPSTHWNAEVYDCIGTPMRRWAQAVIDDLHLGGDETILDAGCGSGSVTFDLLERLPRGRIYAVDSSPDMISKITQAIEDLRTAKPGGRFRAQCGGGANIARLMAATHAVEEREPYSRYLGMAEFRKYRTAEEATAAMERAGWTDVRAELFDSPVRFDNTDDAALYLRTIILQRHVAALPPEHQQPFLEAVIAETVRRYGEPFTADYVRLDLWARKP